MKQAVLVVNGLIIAFLWTLMYVEVFKRSVLQKKIYFAIHFVTLALTHICLINISSIYTNFISIAVSLLLFWAFEKEITTNIFINCLTVFLLLKAVFLISAISTLVLFALFNCEWDHVAINLTQIVLVEIVYIITIHCLDNVDMQVLQEKFNAFAIIVLEVLFLATYAYIKEPYFGFAKEFRKYIIFVLIGLFIILIVWILNNTKYQRRVDGLLRAAHKYKEMIPAISLELQRLYQGISKTGKVQDIERLKNAIMEIEALRKFYGIEDQVEYCSEQTVDTTGFIFLDSQLLSEQGRASENNVSYDIMVHDPVSDIVEEGTLTLTLVERVIGDLYRNAATAVSTCGEPGRILLSMGKTSNGYQIRMCDTGVPFDVAVLKHFGERGISTSGSGHGTADILEALYTCGASMQIDDYGIGNRTYSKGISIIFDGLGKLRITSLRPEIPSKVLDIALIVEKNREKDLQR